MTAGGSSWPSRSATCSTLARSFPLGERAVEQRLAAPSAQLVDQSVRHPGPLVARHCDPHAQRTIASKRMSPERPGSTEPPGPPDPPGPRLQLTDGDTGRWVVTTLTSRYFLDLDTRQVMRRPGGTNLRRPGSDSSGVAALRNDGDVVPLRSVAHCRVGDSLVLYLDLRGDGVVTIRQSTQVTTIEAVPPRSTS